MSKDGKKKNGVKVIDNTLEGNGKDVEAVAQMLEGMTDDQRKAFCERMGLVPKKDAKPKASEQREQFQKTAEKFGEMSVTICKLLNEFPGPVAVTFEVSPEGEYSANIKRVRTKYGPRKGKN